MDTSNLIDALRQALILTPDNLPLRKHLADLLMESGFFGEAEKEYRLVLAQTPQDEQIKLGLTQAFVNQEKWMMALVILEEWIKDAKAPAQIFLLAARVYLQTHQKSLAASMYRQAITKDATLADRDLASQLALAEGDLPEPEADEDEPIRIPVEDWPHSQPDEIERPKISFADVGGMDKLKDDIRMKIIHPLTNPEIYKAYGKTVGGGLLMYGPPGCGKTHLARATAGEVNAYFISIGIHDVLNMYLGQSEQNLHQLFEVARSHNPCVLFIDEIDALGASRTDMRRSAGRHLINQLLAELDGIDASNKGVLVLAATNAPWHLDPAIMRPGRFDRVIFVPPPDVTSRAAILRVALKDKPTDNIDVDQVAKKTEGFSGADIKGLIDTAIEMKLHEALKKGRPVPLTTRDLLRSINEMKPSTKDWFASARNYALYANQSGLYDDVLAYLKVEKDSDLLSRLAFWRGDQDS